MTQRKNTFETSARETPRIGGDLLHSTEYNSPSQLAGNKTPALRDQFKLGRTDDQIIDEIIMEFSSSKNYNNFISVPNNEFPGH